MNKKNNKIWLMIVAAGALIGVIYSFAYFVGGVSFGRLSQKGFMPDESFAIIKIYGTIQGSNEGGARAGYDHAALLEYIDELMYDDSNKGILLDIDSPGGTVYHSDEMYLKLMEYKEYTGRPIEAYFRSMAASGGYYIASSASYISANRNCWTGSIGVIITVSNFKGLYDKLGIQEILITSGENKGMGSSGKELTQEQYDIYQGLVDDSYNNFVDIVVQSRGMTQETVRAIADGRVYTASQAVKNNLIDSIGSYEAAVEKMEEQTGVQGYHRSMYIPSYWEELFLNISKIIPKSNLEVAQAAIEESNNGIPMYIYNGK